MAPDVFDQWYGRLLELYDSLESEDEADVLFEKEINAALSPEEVSAFYQLLMQVFFSR